MTVGGSEIILSRPEYTAADFAAGATITSLETGKKAGIVFCLDDPANPQNYCELAHNGTTITLKKYLAGVATTLMTKTQVYATNDRLKAVKQGTSVRVYCNDIPLEKTFTIDDAALVDNLYAGMIWSDGSNAVSSWTEAFTGLDAYFAVTDGCILAIGDSITVGADDPAPGTGYVQYLMDDMFAATQGAWIEKPERYATGGYTVADIKAGIDAALAARSDTPDIIIIYLGANDCFPETWAAITEEDWKADYEYILDALHTKWASAKIYLGDSWRASCADAIATMSGWMDDLIAARSAYCFKGVNGPAIFATHPELLTGGQVHPTHDGHLLLAAAWAVVLTA